MSNSNRNSEDFKYDVCLSFAGEDREYVESVAKELRDRGIRVFYDRYEQIELWGKDLFSHLDDVYKNAARYCVMFISCHYAKKVWTNHERKSAQARALIENTEYVLPTRFDKTNIPGLHETVGYVDLHDITPIQLADKIQQKVGQRQSQNYLPPIPDFLFDALDAKNNAEKDQISGHAERFLEVLRRMTDEERDVIFNFFIYGCAAELPENIHINVDLLRRCTDITVQKLKRILGSLLSLGFSTSLCDEKEACGQHIGKSQIFILEWHDMVEDYGGNATDVVFAMINGAMAGCCKECGYNALKRLDFSQLASVTKTIDEH